MEILTLVVGLGFSVFGKCLPLHLFSCFFFQVITLVQICIALEDFQLLLFQMCKIVQVLTPMALACMVDFSCRGFPGRGSARSMGNSCVVGGSKDLFRASFCFLLQLVYIFRSKIQTVLHQFVLAKIRVSTHN